MSSLAGVVMRKSLQKIEVAMEQLARIGQGRQANAVRSARARLHLAGVTQTGLRGVVEHSPVRISDLARATDMGDAAVSRQVTLLEDEGLVVRAPDPQDGRVARVRPTPAGRGASRRLRAAADEIFQEHLSEWCASDLEKLAGLMERLVVDLRQGIRLKGRPKGRPEIRPGIREGVARPRSR
jgi:DNA-binding MarR family transcriptional regulator